MTQMRSNAVTVYQVHDVDELKQRLFDVWHGFEQSVIDMWKYDILRIYRLRVTFTRCSAIAERPRCRVRYSFRQK